MSRRPRHDKCLCGQEKLSAQAWCYQCRRHISTLGDMNRLVLLARIKQSELHLALLRAAMEEGNVPEIY
jgi:hypothetical protein